MKKLERLPEPRAELALAVYCRRLKGYVGQYYAHLGRVEAIAFTAGVGENAPEVRARALDGLEKLGIEIDPERNTAGERGTRRVSTDAMSPRTTTARSC